MDERREGQRFPVNLKAVYNHKDAPEAKECDVIDISPEEIGVRLHLQDEFTMHEQLEIKLRLPLRAETVDFIVEVRWIKELDAADSGFAIGCKLLMIDLADKRALLEYACQNWFKKL